MSISKMIAANMLQYKLAHELTTVELAEELHLAVSTTQEYLNGDGNPRTDTLEMIARQMGISVAQLISSPSLDQPRPVHREPLQRRPAKNAVRFAKELAQLPPGKREQGIRLFLEMVELWSGAG